MKKNILDLINQLYYKSVKDGYKKNELTWAISKNILSGLKSRAYIIPINYSGDFNYLFGIKIEVIPLKNIIELRHKSINLTKDSKNDTIII